jgi:KDO2-lipid IV(A) lauroyltransferase
MDLRELTNKASVLRIGYALGRIMPTRVGYVLADGVTRLLARRADSPLMQTLRANLRGPLGPEAGELHVQRTAETVLRHAGRVYFDLYKALAVGPEALLASVRSTTFTDYYLAEATRQGRGALLIGAHVSNFDLAALSFAYRGLQLTGLTFALPPSGYSLQNEVRRAGGIDVMPIDVSALRKALGVLRRGGLVATAVDRPDPFGGGEMLPFFGRPARLPVGHIRLALQTNCPILIATCEHRPTDGAYVVHISRWMEMERVGDREENVTHNALRVLETLEQVISARPQQWLMFYPVWEETHAEAN